MRKLLQCIIFLSYEDFVKEINTSMNGDPGPFYYLFSCPPFPYPFLGVESVFINNQIILKQHTLEGSTLSQCFNRQSLPPLRLLSHL